MNWDSSGTMPGSLSRDTGKPNPAHRSDGASAFAVDIAHATIGSGHSPCVEIVFMSLERSSNLPGGFQVRHRSLGVYQGSAIELAFWYPSSGMPEYGLCRFATKEKAESYRTYLCSPACPEPLDKKDLTVEPYDLAAHEELIDNHPLPSAWETPT